MNVACKNKIAVIVFVIFALLKDCFGDLYAQSYGLTFFSHEAVLEKRTSLDLTGNEPICFSGKLDLSFDLGFVPDYIVYFGYVFRLINDKEQNIDLIYDQKKQIFRLVVAETFTDINFGIDDNTLKRDWTHMKFSIDAKGNISCHCNNKAWQSKNTGLTSTCFKLFFGVCNEHNFISRDLPPMRLKNISIGVDGKAQNFWPLNETSGSNADDTINHRSARINHPDWIKPKHNNWTRISTLSVKGTPSLAFDPVHETLFIVGTDSLYTMQARNAALTASALAVPHANLLAGNQSIYNPHNGKLYNFFADQKTVAMFDFAGHRWNRNFDKGEVTEFWQANKFITRDSNLYVVGGYGQLKYKNTVQKYSFPTSTWSTVEPKGNFLAPRYLSALGVTASTDTAYIIGGYGSKEGDQLLSPRYFYDLLLFDAKLNKFRKIYSLPEPEKQFVFANSLVIDSNGQNYYTLVFPNDRFNSNLQLIKGSLAKPAYTLLGSPFPYSFSDVKSFADLYYCKKSNFLLAATLYTNKNDVTEINVYRINFPVNDLTREPVAEKPAEPGSRYIYLVIIAGLFILAIVYFVSAGKKKGRKLLVRQADELYEQERKEAAPLPHQDQLVSNPAVNIPPVHDPSLQPVHPPIWEKGAHAQTITSSSISPAVAGNEFITDAGQHKLKGKIVLFGNFEVITEYGSNITKQFTPLLKEMFLLILIDSLRYKKGVTAEKLNDVLWNDKDIKDAKNNRSVNLVKLKNILDKVGGCTINRETGAWKFECDPALVKIDFLDYLDIFNSHPALYQPAIANNILAIVEAGAFLQQTHYEWLDTLKAEISNFVIESLLIYVRSLGFPQDAEKVIAISNAIFSFDELNEHALKLHCKSLVALGRHTLAKNTFDRFKNKYKDIYGEDFKESYHSVFS